MLQKYNKKNDNIRIFIDGKLYKRHEAKISVFDSLVQGGDGVWEGIRIYNGRIFCFEAHLRRLIESAKSLDFKNIPSISYIKDSILTTLKSNNMKDNVHIRLTLSRGIKITSGMNPKLNQSGCTLIVLAEWKPPIYSKPIKLITSSVRRNSPACLDSKIHHNNLINNILAKIEANYAGVDDAIMLDLDSFVSETNATNIFMIKDSVVYTPCAKSCLPGITRNTIIDLCKDNNIPIAEKDISITELYNADNVFTTGTMGELAQVIEIDNRKLASKKGNILVNILDLFHKMTEKEGFILPF